ncbi:MAG: DUF1462 family protein [Sporolactobacillus sp.]
MNFTVYGAEAICPSCMQSPPSRATAEWLQAALARKFGAELHVRYVDIDDPQNHCDEQFCEQIKSNQLFYPLVVSGEEIIAEGYVDLKAVVDYISQRPDGDFAGLV